MKAKEYSSKKYQMKLLMKSNWVHLIDRFRTVLAIHKSSPSYGWVCLRFKGVDRYLKFGEDQINFSYFC